MPSLHHWIPARVIRISTHGFGVSVDASFMPQYLHNYKRLVGLVWDGEAVWQQKFTVIKSQKRSERLHLLAISPGGVRLRQLYMQGVRQVFIAGLVPA